MSQPDPDFACRADPYRRELLVHSDRMLGSYHDPAPSGLPDVWS